MVLRGITGVIRPTLPEVLLIQKKKDGKGFEPTPTAREILKTPPVPITKRFGSGFAPAPTPTISAGVIAEQRRIEEQRFAEEARKAESQRQAQLKTQAEAQRKAEQQRFVTTRRAKETERARAMSTQLTELPRTIHSDFGSRKFLEFSSGKRFRIFGIQGGKDALEELSRRAARGDKQAKKKLENIRKEGIKIGLLPALVPREKEVGFGLKEFRVRDIRKEFGLAVKELREGFPKSLAQISKERGELLEKRRKGEKISIPRRVQAFAGGATLSSLLGVTFARRAVTKPIATTKETIKAIPELPLRIIAGVPVVIATAKAEPEFAAGFVASEVGQAVALGKVAGAVGKGARVVRTRISPKFKPIIKTPKGKIVKIPSKISPTGELIIKISRPVKEITEPLAKQVRLAGTTQDIVTAQRGLFGKITKRKITVKKPTPTPKAPPLEQALFADPRGRLRISRLGIIDEGTLAKLSDLLKGRVTFKRPKAQAIIFEQEKIAKFPKSLRGVEIKLKAGKSLTPSEQAKLLRFQLKPTGKFKPIGFLSKEPEVTLAPGEIVRRVKTPAVTLIKGERVEFIKGEIVRAKPKTAALLKQPTLTLKELKSLTKRLSKETGFDVSRAGVSKPFVSPVSLAVPSVAAISRAISGVSRRPPIRRRLSGKQISRSISRIPKISIPISPPPRRPPRVPIIISPPISPPPRRPPIITPIIDTPIKIPIFEELKIRRRKRFKPISLKEDKLLIAGFTARALGITKKIKVKDILKEATKFERGISFRPIPIIRR